MITRVEATNFRCLKSVSQTLRPFQVLVGPNSSGKSAFLDAIDFLSDIVSSGLNQAVEWRTENFHDLVWGRGGDSITLAIEAQMPEAVRAAEDARTIRYGIRIRLDGDTDQLVIDRERLITRSDAGQERPVLLREARRASFWDETGAGMYNLGGVPCTTSMVACMTSSAPACITSNSVRAILALLICQMIGPNSLLLSG